MNIENYNCIEGDHKLNPEFSAEFNSKGTVRCITCGLVYMDSENPDYSMKLLEELKIYNLKGVIQ